MKKNSGREKLALNVRVLDFCILKALRIIDRPPWQLCSHGGIMCLVLVLIAIEHKLAQISIFGSYLLPKSV